MNEPSAEYEIGESARGQGAGEPTSPNCYPLQFTGSGREYFRIWIVNIVLTILTLFIYSAWAKVRNKRYFYGNTVLDGSSFDYHAKPTQILAGRLIAVAVLLIVTFAAFFNPIASVVASILIALLAPWALWRSTVFNARMSSYRHIRFDFRGGLKSYYLYWLLLPMLPVLIAALAIGLMATTDAAGNQALVALGAVALLALPIAAVVYYIWIRRKFHSYYIGQHAYGTASFDTELSTGNYLAIYVQAFIASSIAAIVMVLLFALVGGLVALAAAAMFGGIEAYQKVLDSEFIATIIGSGLLIAVYLAIVLIGVISASFLRALLRNYQFNNSRVDGIHLQSDVNPVKLSWISFGNVVLTLLTLGLFYPWGKVRIARYLASCSSIISDGTLDGFVGRTEAEAGALGDELGEAFDFDVGIGI